MGIFKTVPGCPRLTPLNADRAKVAGMLIRSVFELPDPEDDSLVDASAEAGSGRSPIWDVLAVILVKAKVSSYRSPWY